MRVAILGTPSNPDVEWTDTNLSALSAAGFTAIQLNIAWSYRPADEPLNLEDVIDSDGPVPSRADPSRGDIRRQLLSNRSARARAHGMRTLFHFGAPYQGRSGFNGDRLPQCISDPQTTNRYGSMLAALARQFPNIDDVLMYTYDQDAWVCSEFGECERCAGIPLHLRISTFVNTLGAVWKSGRPEGRLWWEPWELSSGQALAAIPLLRSEEVGLMLHSSIAEVISTMSADRFFVTATRLAQTRGIPVVAEVFMSSSNEEVEPWTSLPVPLVTVRQLRTVAAVPGVTGFKEYFGITPRDNDVNFAAAKEYFREPGVSDDALLNKVAGTFGHVWLAEFWAATSEAYELFPWDSTWFARQMGRSQPLHEMTAATVRGMQSNASQWETPAWRSSRGAMFMRTDNSEPHSWLLEDVQLRCAASADQMERALEIFQRHTKGAARASGLAEQADEAEAFVIRARAHALHLRATTLAATIRKHPGAIERLQADLRATLVADLANQRREVARRRNSPSAPAGSASSLQLQERWVVPPRTHTAMIEDAIATLDADPKIFLATYLQPAADEAAAGQFTFTSS